MKIHGTEPTFVEWVALAYVYGIVYAVMAFWIVAVTYLVLAFTGDASAADYVDIYQPNYVQPLPPWPPDVYQPPVVVAPAPAVVLRPPPCHTEVVTDESDILATEHVLRVCD